MREGPWFGASAECVVECGKDSIFALWEIAGEFPGGFAVGWSLHESEWSGRETVSISVKV